MRAPGADSGGLSTRSCLACRAEFQGVPGRPFGRDVPCPACTPESWRRDGVRPEGGTAKGAAQRQRVDLLQALYEAGVNVHKYKSATLETFDAAEDPQALAAATDFLQVVRDTRGDPYPTRPWMYLFGEGSAVSASKAITPGKRGNGKTHLAVAIARQLLQEGALQPNALLFTTAERIFLESEATFRAGSETSEIQLLRRYAAPELLIIDDIGVRPPTSPHALRLLAEVQERRMGRATIWTSNLSLETLEQLAPGMNHLTDRIVDDCQGARFVVRFRGRTRRLDAVRRPQLREVMG